MKSKASLRKITIIFTIISVVVPVLSISSWYGLTILDQQLNTELDKERWANTLVSVKLDSEYERFKTLLKNKSDIFSHLIGKENKVDDVKKINKILMVVAGREAAIHKLRVMSLDGEIIADGGIYPHKVGDESSHAVDLRAAADEIKVVVDSPEIVIPTLGRIYTGSPKKQGQAFVFSIAVPVGSPVKAVLVAWFDVNKLWLSIDGSQGESGEGGLQSYALDRRGALLTDISSSELKAGDLMTHLPITRHALANKAWPAATSYSGVNNERVFGAVTTIASLNWALVSEVRVSQVLQPIWNFLATVFLIILFFMCFFITLLLRFLKLILTPIEEASRAIEQVAQGNYDYHLKAVGINEIDTMTSGIECMSEARKQADNALQASQHDLQVTLNSIGDAVIACDGEGRVTRMNPVAQTLTGWTLEEALGEPIKTVFSIVHATTRQPISNPIEQVINSGEVVYLSNHTTLLARDGSEYQIADSAAPIRNDDNKILGMVLVFNDVTEAYQLREQAKAVLLQLQDLINDMHTMVVVTDPAGIVVFANKTPLAVLGVKLDDVLGKWLWDCPWFDADTSLQIKMKKHCLAAGTGKNIQFDFQISTLAGLVWLEYGMHSVLNEQGEVIRIVHEGRVINQRKAIEDDLRTSAQHLKLYREQMALAAIEWSVDLKAVSLNKAAEEMFGYTLENNSRHNIADVLFTDEERANAKVLLKGLNNSGEGLTSRTKTCTKDGHILLCEWHTTLLRDELDKVVGVASVVLDITAQQKAQRDLVRKEQEQREILDCMVDAVITIDHNAHILSCNKRAEALFGYGAEEIVGANINMLIPNDGDRWENFLDFSFGHGAQLFIPSREIEGRHKNEQNFALRLLGAELPDDASGTRRFILTCHDLTDIKHQEEQLRRSQKMDALGKLTGGIAHDFNNMLGVVIGYADLLEGLLEDQPRSARYVHEIKHAGKRGAKLTKKLLSFSRQETALASSVELNRLLLEQQDMLQKTLTVRISLLFDLGDDIWPIWLDSSDLEDAVLNMSINAMHAMEEQVTATRLTILTRNQSFSSVEASAIGLAKEGDYVLLSLTDTGAGIDEETRGKIFDPFFSTKGDKGTGLGLSQVFGFAKRAGGLVKVYSEIGHGSEFMLYFPRYLDGDVNLSAGTTGLEKSLSGSESILVVDDEVALRELAVELLNSQGYQVFSAENGQQALKILQHESIDLMLSDIIMPEMSGYQLAALVREKYPAIKIQLASGFADHRDEGMVDKELHKNLLHKPYNAKNLFQAIRIRLDSGV